jgi:hypothetical protein
MENNSLENSGEILKENSNLDNIDILLNQNEQEKCKSINY